jgi:DNA topoisomerase-1
MSKVQASGIDGRGRRQYIYHPEWVKFSQKEKFDKLCGFGKKLPGLRDECKSLLENRNLGHDQILALILLILDETGIRIGNRQYQKLNSTFGLTNLRRKHLHIEDNKLIFDFRGKSGKDRHVEIDDTEVIEHIRTSAEQPGYSIFRYKNEKGDWRSVDSSDVNEFIGEKISGYSSKFFRTWVANRLAIELWPDARQLSANSRKETVNILVERVASELGNTPAICREYYLHPKVLKLATEENLPVIRIRDQDTAHEIHAMAEKKLLDILCG